MKKAIKMTISCSYIGEDEIIIPLEDNLDAEGIYDDEEDRFEILKSKWTEKDFSYGNVKAQDMQLVDVYTQKEADDILLAFDSQVKIPLDEEFLPARPEPLVRGDDMTKCTEFDIWCFTEDMIDPRFYSSPFSCSSDGNLYSCWIAVECDKGTVYSKDFAYFDCEDCNRTICEQDLRNGWHTQYRMVNDCTQICLSCFEKDQLENGCDVEEVINDKTIPGMFFNMSELVAKGFSPHPSFDFVLVGSGRSGYSSPDNFFEKLQAHKDFFEDKITIINYDDMAIGGLGGYVTVYTKDK